MEDGSESGQPHRRIAEILKAASPEAQQLVGDVLRLEQQQIHKKRATGIAEDIVDITKRLVT